jgi:hypothetical protein
MRLAVRACVIFGLVSGGCCSNPNIYNAAQEKDGALVASFDAKKRAIILLRTGMTNNNNNLYVCPEAPPDVATEVASDFTTALKLTYGTTGLDASLASKIAETFRQISPTSEATTLLRSSLSQFCWLTINRQLSHDETMKGFDAILATARGLAYRDVAQSLVEQIKLIGPSPENADARKQVLEALKVILVQASGNPAAVGQALDALRER